MPPTEIIASPMELFVAARILLCIAALLACVLCFLPRLRYRPFLPIAVAFSVSAVGEFIRDALAISLDIAPVPYQGMARLYFALDVSILITGLFITPAAIWHIFRGKTSIHFAGAALALFLALAIPYPTAPWTRGAGQAFLLSIVANLLFAASLFAFVSWVRLRKPLGPEHRGALALLLAHGGLVLGPYSLLSKGAELYSTYAPYAALLFGLAFVAIIIAEVSWIRRSKSP